MNQTVPILDDAIELPAETPEAAARREARSQAEALMQQQRARKGRRVPLQHAEGQPIRYPPQAAPEAIKAARKTIKKQRRALLTRLHAPHTTIPFPKESAMPRVEPCLTESEAHQHLCCAICEGLEAQPEFAAGAVIDRLSTAFGPVVQKIIALIQEGLTNLPAILAALQAAGIALPSWMSIVVEILIAITAAKPPLAA